MGKLKAVIINNDKSYEEKTVKTKEREAYLSKDWIVTFNQEDVFTKNANSAFKGKKRTIFVREGKKIAEKISSGQDAWLPLTTKEEAMFIKKLMLKSRLQQTKTELIYIVIVLVLVAIGLTVASMAGVRFR